MTSSSVFDDRMARWLQEQNLPWMRLKYRLVQALLARHVGPAPQRILDAGGGNGFDSIPLAAQGHLVDLVDYSQEMLADAARQAAAAGAEGRVTLHHADVQSIPELFPDAQFDFVLCHNVLQYVADVPALLRGLIAPLKAGVLISVISINRYSIPYHLAFLRGDLAAALAQIDARGMQAAIFDAQMTNYSADEIGAMLRDAGCAVEHDYGIRCMCDYWGDNERKADPAVFAQIEGLESALADRYPYKLLARYFMVVARAAACRRWRGSWSR